LLTRPLAIVDIETAGSSALYGRVIEVAVLRVENGVLVDSFHSLVDPQRPIPPSIEQLTGITNDDLRGAPTFGKIARKLLAILDGAIFVAHSARFDYGLLKNEFRRGRREFTARTLCTVRLSRLLFPQHRHHDLTSVIGRHGLPCQHRHRALDDAMAVFEFLKHLQDTEPQRLAEGMAALLRAATLPPHLDLNAKEDLPERPGVYLLYGKDRELLYVGKSVNIKARVLSHFSGDHASGRQMEMTRSVHSIETRTTAGELGALLLESKLIKELQPIYNQVSRRKRNLIVARRHLTPQGYLAIALEEIERIEPDVDSPIMALFRSFKQGKEFLARTGREYHLCQKLLGLERTQGYCFAYHLQQCNGACKCEEGAESYNQRVEQAFAGYRIKAWPFAGGIMIEERSSGEEGEVFLIDRWCLVASYRYSELGFERHIPGDYRFDVDSYRILTRYLFNRANRKTIRHVPRAEFERMLAATAGSGGVLTTT
jgi:DNA polymerase III subunit epsilon